MKSSVSEKGQVTIPKALREQLGIRPGQVLEFKEEKGRIVAIKLNSQDPVDELYGIIKLDRSTDKAISEIRGESMS